MKYSLLTSDQSIINNIRQIESHLKDGIKIILFCNEAKCKQFSDIYYEFVNVKLLQLHPVKGFVPLITIIDGTELVTHSNILITLSQASQSFNYEQYSIEHCNITENIIIEASAGTGKTTVMIDRILFLIHMIPELSLEDIGMITFTNEATDSMKSKLQSLLINRFAVTKSNKYIKYLESVSRMDILTIHKFSQNIISDLGSSVGYGASVNLRSYNYDKKQLIYNALDNLYNANQKNTINSLGLNLHEIVELITKFWKQLENIGLTDDEILTLDWGTTDKKSSALQNSFSNIFFEVNTEYSKIKLQNDSIAVGDIVRELNKIINGSRAAKLKSRKIKFLFVDEFQDSDNAQIKTLIWLHKTTGVKLFVVGDIKQSIYRFRGAVETSFSKLKDGLQSKPQELKLSMNYRTSIDLLNKMDSLFMNWDACDLLNYSTRLLAQKKIPGIYNIHTLIPKENIIKEKTLSLIKDCLIDCEKYTLQNNLENDSSQKVTVLTRTNYELTKISNWCIESNIPCYIKKDGSFYQSKAVIDFFVLLKSHIFINTSKHIFDYLISPYSNLTIADQNQLICQSGNQKTMQQDLNRMFNNTSWYKYHKQLKLKPILSVIQTIIEEIKPVENFAKIRKAELLSSNEWDSDDLNNQLYLETLQYKKNLDKLLQSLRESFSGEIISMYYIYNFLQIQINTNFKENEPDISNNFNFKYLHGLTVHKAKGLEFDTVLIPFTNRVYRKEFVTEMIIDTSIIPFRVGWNYHGLTTTSTQNNSYYQDIVSKEIIDISREETRLLYVALTRSIRRLEYFLIGNKEYSWTNLLEV